VGRRLISAFGKERVFSVPNVTSVQVLCSRLCEPWEDLKAISLHGREGEGGERKLEEALALHRKIAVLTDPAHTPAWIADKLLEWGYPGAAITVGEDLGAPSETVRTLAAKEARTETFSPLNVVLIDCASGQDTGSGAGKPAQVLGIPEEAFEHDAGLITKLEIRAVALACLRLEPGLVLWDIGAGSGSVSIEAARTARLGLVAAVEKDARRYGKLVENVRDFRCPAVKPVYGPAAQALDGLPAPDRVFIGGSGSELEVILQKTSERLRASGRVVQTAVTLDTLDLVRSFWQKKRFGLSVVQVQASRSAPIGKTVRLEALNPVFIISAWRKT
jgi:precorrin-6Y C5,15-methyltransferase (decarboxylating)